MNLSCKASGIPPPMVYWVKAGGQRVNRSVLMLTNINRNETGEYRCEASNDCGSATERASIVVHCKLAFTLLCPGMCLKVTLLVYLNTVLLFKAEL